MSSKPFIPVVKISSKPWVLVGPSGMPWALAHLCNLADTKHISRSRASTQDLCEHWEIFFRGFFPWSSSFRVRVVRGLHNFDLVLIAWSIARFELIRRQPSNLCWLSGQAEPWLRNGRNGHDIPEGAATAWCLVCPFRTGRYVDSQLFESGTAILIMCVNQVHSRKLANANLVEQVF